MSDKRKTRKDICDFDKYDTFWGGDEEIKKDDHKKREHKKDCHEKRCHEKKCCIKGPDGVTGPTGNNLRDMRLLIAFPNTSL